MYLNYKVMTELVLFAKTVAVSMLNNKLTNSRKGAVVHLYLTSLQFVLPNEPDLNEIQMMTECLLKFAATPERNLYIIKLG